MNKKMPSVSLDTRLIAASDIVSTDLDGEEVILDLSTGTYFGLNPVGARIWRLLERGLTLRRISETILKEYEVDSDRLEADLLEIADTLKENGLVVDA